MQKQILAALVSAFQTDFPTEIAHRQAILQFIHAHEQPTDRNNKAGHVTASGWVIDTNRECALLVHHRKLDKWLQPGGHIEPADADIFTAASREVQEECGLTLTPQRLFDLDVHLIPANSKESAHWHYDIRVLFVAPAQAPVGQQAAEVEEVRWFRLEGLLQNDNESVARMAQKTLHLPLMP